MIQLFGYSFAFLYEESLCLSITLLSYMISDKVNESQKQLKFIDPVPKRKAKTNQVFVELPKLFAVKKVFHSFSCAEQLCFGMMWAVKQSAFLT